MTAHLISASPWRCLKPSAIYGLKVLRNEWPPIPGYGVAAYSWTMTAQERPHGFKTNPATARYLPKAGGHLLAGGSDANGQFTLIHSIAPPADSTPLHRHMKMDESFYVLSGSYTVTCGDNELEVVAGDFVHLPHGIPHKFVAGPDGGEKLILGSPGGLETFFDDWEAGVDFAALSQKHAIEFLE